MWGISRFSTALLAAQSQTFNSIRDGTTAFRDLYETLGDRPPVYKQASPTIKFSYVTPPANQEEDWRDDHVFYADSYLMNSTTDANDNDIISKISHNYGTDKPIAVYLPGLDGYGISAAPWQFNDLSSTFELWRMTVSVEDRSTFGELVTNVANFIDEVAGSTSRPIYIIGESFGGLLTPAVTLRLQRREGRGGKPNPIKGMVLVNPATSFDDSNWDVLAPALATLDTLTNNGASSSSSTNPSPYAVLGSLTLSALIPSSNQLQQIVNTISSMDSTRDPFKIQQTISETLDSFKLTAEKLPSDLLAHRISKWLMVGSTLVQSRLHTIDLPTLLIAGRDDNLLGSNKEVSRLEKILPQSEKLVVSGAGHFTLDDKVNLTEAILYSKLDPLKRTNTFDPILDWELPPPEVIEQEYNSSVKPQEDAFSPVFMSTDDRGKRHMGLDMLPSERPILFVSNHQLLGVDLSMLISGLIDHGIPVRGLAHPVIFQSSNQVDELGGRTPGIRETEGGSGGRGPSTTNFRKYGAVMVTPRNYYRVLQSGQSALLFPGGVREVFHGKDEAYQLFWPEKVDFVRTAARFNATIVPVSAVGMADTLNILVDSSEIVNLPILGERAKRFAANVTAARFDTDNSGENFLPPIVAPGLPSRNYFVFGKPFQTMELDPKDRNGCESIYSDIQAEMKRGFDDVLRARKKDNFMEAAPRLVYERVTGKKAPTFDIKEMNNVL